MQAKLARARGWPRAPGCHASDERRRSALKETRRMPLRSVLLASAASLVAAQANAFTINILHINDFHSRIESINAFDFHLLGRGGGRRRVLRRRGAAEDRDHRSPRRAHRRRRERARARRRRRVPGLAVLQQLLGRSRARDDERHRLRRDGGGQPRVSTSGRSRWRRSSPAPSSTCFRATPRWRSRGCSPASSRTRCSISTATRSR